MKHILIVDDVTTNLKCAAEVLKDTYDVTTAKSGKAALQILREIQPDLIMLDVNMPEMNGFEVMERIKEDPVTRDIPVIFLTAEADKENEVTGLKMGAMDFIKKPFEPDIMRSRIEKILQMTEQTKELQNIAGRDSLTNLLNRRCFEKILNQPEEGKENGFFLLLDLDNFKQVNDTFGHVIGDQVLIKFARVMEEEASPEDAICRIGGDEFAIFIPGTYEKSKIKSIARRMIAGIEFEVNDLLLDTCDFKLSVSIGIAEKPEDGSHFAELYAAADKALYYVKQNGKRGCYFYHTEEGKEKELDEDNNLIDLLQLQRLIQEKSEQSGAYRVEYDGFKRIYHFVSRCMERKSQDVQLVLFTIQEQEHIEGENEKPPIEILEEAVSKSLRRGDVATRCGNTQYVAILMNASEENGTLVVKRIQKKFSELSGDGRLTLGYEMVSVGKKEE
ncbi:MAG: diguanylate cyclase [Lachnospiraceae bacterium]|nr:diguanylate cyclase [Lachnospiraceae bacterium]